MKEIFEGEFVKKNINIDFVIPVPMNYIKEYIKGYNHAGQIAREMFAKSQYCVLPFALKKKFTLSRQAGSSRFSRLQNTQNIYYINTKYNFYNKSILLIDDILTTGSTANECAKVLFGHGACAVYVLTFAKSIKDEEILDISLEN